MISSAIPRSIRINLLVFVIVIFTFNIVKGIRLPNIWTYTHYLFNYSEGFNKRSLVGEIVRQIDFKVLSTYPAFAFFAYSVFAICAICLIREIYRLSKDDNFISLLVISVFSSSIAIVYFAHTVGFFDHLGLLITFVILSISSFQLRLVLAAILCPIGILIHEAFLFMFIPTIIFSFFIQSNMDARLSKIAIGSLAIWIMGVGYLVANSTLQQNEIEDLHQNLQANSQFKLRADAFEIFLRTGKDNLAIMRDIWSHAGSWLDLFYSLVGTLPTSLFILFATYLVTKNRELSIYTKIIGIGAALSPLVMHVIAWDKERFNCLAIITSFLVYSQITKSTSKTSLYPTNISYHFVMIGIFLSILNFGTDIRLFDDYEIQFFPYRHDIQNILQNLLSGNPIFVMPVR